MASIEQQTRELYNLCFQDDEAFTAAYFKHLYHHNRNVTLTRQGTVVSALQLVPVAIHIENYNQGGAQASYISGVCTHPSYRGKGFMRTLLERALQKMHKMHDNFATLIPANEGLFTYYAASGFIPCFNYSTEIIPQNPMIYPIHQCEIKMFCSCRPRWSYYPIEAPLETLTYTLFKENYDSLSGYYIDERRTYHGYQFGFTNFWNLILEDLKLYGGEGWQVTTPDHFLVGSAICYPQKEHLWVSALTADTPALRQDLIHRLMNHYKLPEIRIVTEPDEALGIRPLGMARIVNADILLGMYAEAHPELKTKFTLTDPIIPENNRTYILRGNGELMHSHQPAPLVTIEQLTQAVLGYQPERLPPVLQSFSPGLPYMHLMLNSYSE